MLRNMLLKWLGLEGASETLASVRRELDEVRSLTAGAKNDAGGAMCALEGAFHRLDAISARIQKAEDALGIVQGFLGLRQGTGWMERAARAMQGDVVVHKEKMEAKGE